MAKLRKIKMPPYTPGHSTYQCDTDRDCRENQICVGGMCRSEAGDNTDDMYNIKPKHKCTPESNRKFLKSRDKRIRERMKDNDWSYVYRYHKSPDDIRPPEKGSFNIQLVLSQWRAGDFDDRIKSLQKKSKKR